MNDLKTYTISEELFIAIIESAYIKGVGNGFDQCHYPGTVIDDKEAVKSALEIIKNQQFVYEN
tara:strand:+ start:168 stop:356 length:189 start_codon:yes stop_codon:yes gene_type:complete